MEPRTRVPDRNLRFSEIVTGHVKLTMFATKPVPDVRTWVQNAKATADSIEAFYLLALKIKR